MKIVCGTDFSANANAAAHAAAVIAARLKSPLWLVHVADHPATGMKADYESTVLAEDALTSLSESLAKSVTVITKTVVMDSAVTPALLNFSRQQSTGLLVVSSVSKTSVQPWTLGSVAEGLAAAAQCPTLIVRSAEQLVGWAQGQSRLKVFLALDLTASCEPAVRWLKQLQQIGPCDIIAGHVTWPREARRRHGVAHGDSPKPALMVEGALQRDLEKRLADVLDPAEIEVRVIENWGRPDAALVEMAREAKADLIVIGTHQREPLSRLALGSVSVGIIRHAEMNVLCVPPHLPALT